MELKIYENSAATVLKYTFYAVASCEMTERLNGELTLSFSVPVTAGETIQTGQVVEVDGKLFDIVRISRTTEGIPMISAECEHVSYRLNNESYNLTTFVHTGSVREGLVTLLSGTPFLVGTCKAAVYDVAITDESPLNRRSALIRYAAAVGAEIKYNGWEISLPGSRGSAIRRELMDGKTVTALQIVTDARANTESYDLAFYKKFDINVGDEVHIAYTPMGIDKNSRVVGMAYNPFYTYAARIEIGDYVPNSISAEVSERQKLRQEFRASDGELLSQIEATDGRISNISQNIESIELSLAEKVDATAVDASIKAYIEGDGEASIVSIVSSETANLATKDEISEFITESYATSIIAQEVDTQLGASLKLEVTNYSEEITKTVESGEYYAINAVPDGFTGNGALYGFVKTDDGYYTSQNAGVNTSYAYGMFMFNNTSGEVKSINLRCINSGESGFDYGVISNFNTYLSFSYDRNADSTGSIFYEFKNSTSVRDDVIIALDLPTGGSFITFKFIKDGSQSKNDDCLKIKAYETVTIPAQDNKATISLTKNGIELSSADIVFDGLVTFTDLSTPGKTTIAGGNIATNSITADKLKVDEIYTKRVRYQDDNYDYNIVSSDVFSSNAKVYLGLTQNIGDGFTAMQYLYLYGTSIWAVESGIDPPTVLASAPDHALLIDTTGRQIVPSRDANWTLGTSSYRFAEVHSEVLYCDVLQAIGGQIRLTSSTYPYITINSSANKLVFVVSASKEYTIDMT